MIKCKLQIFNFFTRTFLVWLISCNLYFIGVTNRTHQSNHSCTGLVFPNLSVVYLAFLRWRTGSTIIKFTGSTTTMQQYHVITNLFLLRQPHQIWQAGKFGHFKHFCKKNSSSSSLSLLLSSLTSSSSSSFGFTNALLHWLVLNVDALY